MPCTREQHAASQARTRARRKAERLCTGCGADLKPLLGWTRIVCPECAERLADADAKYKASAKARETISRARTRLYAERKAAGRCVENGCDEPTEPGMARCLPHIEQHRVWNNQWAERREEAARAG